MEKFRETAKIYLTVFGLLGSCGGIVGGSNYYEKQKCVDARATLDSFIKNDFDGLQEKEHIDHMIEEHWDRVANACSRLKESERGDYRKATYQTVEAKLAGK